MHTQHLALHAASRSHGAQSSTVWLVGMSIPTRKLLERSTKGLKEAGLLVSDAETSTVPDIVRTLIATVSASQSQPLNETQIRAWASAVGDLASDRTLAVESLRLGILPAVPRFLQLYKASASQADISWSESLIALHNFTLCEDQGFTDALEKLDAAEKAAIAVNVTRALAPGLHPSEARDAASRLSTYESMIGPLIDAGVLAALVQYTPNVKPLNRLPQWGGDALREINNSLSALDLLVFMYTKAEREDQLPTAVLADASLTGWVCDVLQGTPSNDARFKEDVEASRVSALECLTSLLINATVCRLAVPSNRSMLFRVASAITSTSSIALLSAAAQVLAQALSEEDLVQPNELASLHTYDLVRHLSQVLDESRDAKDLLNVLAALQNILDPAHFKNNQGALRKVAERLLACAFVEQLTDFLKDIKSHFDVQTLPDGSVFPSQEDVDSLDETAKGALENARTLLEAVGPLNVQVIPRVPRSKEKDKRTPGAGGSTGSRKGASSDTTAPSTREPKPKRKLGDGPSEASKRKRTPTALPLAERVLLEKEMRRAAALAAPLLSASPMRAVLDWFNEWGWCSKRLEEELGSDVHFEGGGHQQLLQDALDQADPWACVDLLRDILQVKLPALKEGMVAPVTKRPPKVAAPAATAETKAEPVSAAPAEQPAVPEPAPVPSEPAAPEAMAVDAINQQQEAAAPLQPHTAVPMQQ